MRNSFGAKQEGSKSSTDTMNDSLSFEEVNYNSASNHMKNFDKYSTKKKNNILDNHVMHDGSSGGLFNYCPKPFGKSVSLSTSFP